MALARVDQAHPIYSLPKLLTYHSQVLAHLLTRLEAMESPQGTSSGFPALFLPQWRGPGTSTF